MNLFLSNMFDSMKEIMTILKFYVKGEVSNPWKRARDAKERSNGGASSSNLCKNNYP